MASLKENVLSAGFVAMTEDELYEVNGGKRIEGKTTCPKPNFSKEPLSSRKGKREWTGSTGTDSQGRPEMRIEFKFRLGK